MENYKKKITSDLSTKKWYLVGNKKDLDKKGNEVPNYYKTKFENYFEISTKTSKDEVFQRMIRDIMHDLNLGERENKNFNLDIGSQNEQLKIDELFNEECNIF
jgi:predicted GTPase